MSIISSTATTSLINRVLTYAFSLGYHYSDFYAGITSDPDRRKTEHGNPPSWKCWRVRSPWIATEVEKMLHNGGMQGGNGGSSQATDLYVFLAKEDRDVYCKPRP
jgi:hypothetical protein